MVVSIPVREPCKKLFLACFGNQVPSYGGIATTTRRQQTTRLPKAAKISTLKALSFPILSMAYSDPNNSAACRAAPRSRTPPQLFFLPTTLGSLAALLPCPFSFLSLFFFNHLHLLTKQSSRKRHRGRTLVTIQPHAPHPKDHIILCQRHPEARNIPDV